MGLEGNVSCLGVLCVSLFVVSLAVAVESGLSILQSFLLACLIAYLPSYLDGAEYTGSRYWDWFARLPWSNFDVEMDIIYDTPLDPCQQYIFTSHPHGVMALHHAQLMLGTSNPAFRDKIPGCNRRHLAAPVCFRIPFYREFMLWIGCINSKKPYAVKALKDGKSLFILVGGVIEQLLCNEAEQSVYIRNRKGFIKLALQNGVSIVPSYNFGLTELYYASPFLLSWRQAIAKKYNFPILFACGPKWYLPFKPRSIKINQVFGKPLCFEKVESPTPDQIDHLHRAYITEIERIFSVYKRQYGFENTKMALF